MQTCSYVHVICANQTKSWKENNSIQVTLINSHLSLLVLMIYIFTQREKNRRYLIHVYTLSTTILIVLFTVYTNIIL